MLFFGRVVVFEEVVDRHNLAMGRDDRLHPLARTINALHHADEVRHLMFGRRVVADLWREHSAGWRKETVARVRAGIEGFLLATWQQLYNPRAYADAGLADAAALRREAWEHSRPRRRQMSERCVRGLIEAGVLIKEPEL